MTKYIRLLALTALIPFNAFAILNGQSANDPQFSAVGAIVQTADATMPLCTGTLIAKDWVITAGHCMFGGSEQEPVDYTAKDLKFVVTHHGRAKAFAIKQLHIIGHDYQGPDIAFLQLASKVPASQTTPIPLALSSWREAGPVTVVGFGPTIEYGSVSLQQKTLAAMIITRGSVTAADGTLVNAFESLFQSEKKFSDYLKANHRAEDMDKVKDESEALSAHWEAADLRVGERIHVWDSVGRENLDQVKAPANGWQETCFGDSGGPVLKEVGGKLAVTAIVSTGFRGLTAACVPIGTMAQLIGSQLKEFLRSNQIQFID